MSDTVTVVYWQTVGGSVEIPRDKLKAFVSSLENNCVEDEFWGEISHTFIPTHYEAQVVSVEDAEGEYLEVP